MDKIELRAEWGNYCDTDKLVDDIMALLSRCNWNNTERGVCSMLNTYFTNKRNLIELFATSNHYIGNMRIVLDIELERENSESLVRNHCNNFLANIGAYNHIVTNVDERGKKITNYLSVSMDKLEPQDLFSDELKEALMVNNDNTNNFNEAGEYIPSYQRYNNLWNFMYYTMAAHPWSTLRANVVNAAKQLNTPVMLTEGMKTSRAFNKVCNAYGLDTLPKYNKLFAEYADLVSGLKRKLKFFISLNPLDYLTMSFGVNWSSCHNIKTHGGWAGGTLSYMLDSSSIITYVHEHIPTDIEEGKIYRNMFHFENDMLIQSRIYPQGNDGAKDLYKEFRDVVQTEFAELLGLEENLWVKKPEIAGTYIASQGVHYRDYNTRNDCTASYPKERAATASDVTVHVGHHRICPRCGRVINSDNNTGYLTHTSCCL